MLSKTQAGQRSRAFNKISSQKNRLIFLRRCSFCPMFIPISRKSGILAKEKIASFARMLIGRIPRRCRSLMRCYLYFSKCSLPTPHAGQVQSSGMSSKAVPGAMPPSGSPSAGSYMYPQMMQTYLSIILRVLEMYSNSCTVK